MKRDLRNLGRGNPPRVQPAPAKPPSTSALPQDGMPNAKGNIPDVLQTQGVSQSDMNTIQSAVEHYSGKSDRELMDELADFRKSGAIDDERLADVAARLAPMLNPQQRARLESVMGTLKKK